MAEDSDSEPDEVRAELVEVPQHGFIDDESALTKIRGKALSSLRKAKDRIASLTTQVQEVTAPDLCAMSWMEPDVLSVSSPTPRYGHSMDHIDGVLYIIGGTDGERFFDSVYLFDIENKSWSAPQTTGAKLKPRSRHASTVITVKKKSQILIFGGAGKGNLPVDNELLTLSPETLTWDSVRVEGIKPVPRWGHSLVYRDRGVIMIGGHDGTKSLNEVWEIDMKSAWRWVLLNSSGDMPVPGSKHTAVPWDSAKGRLLVLGGSQEGTFDHVFDFDQALQKWKKIETTGEVPVPRSRHASCTSSGSVFVFGGIGGGRAINDIRVLHTSVMIWSTPEISGEVPPPRMDHAMVAVKNDNMNHIYVFGGFDGQKALSDMHILVTMKWTQLHQTGTSPPPRIGHTLTLVGQQLFLLGGATSGNVYNDVRVFDLLKSSWSLINTLGNPPRALFGHCVSLVGNELYVFGGGDGNSSGNSLMLFNTDAMFWDDRPPVEGQPPRRRYGCVSCYHERTLQLFVIGGYAATIGYGMDVFVIETSTLTWREPKIAGQAPPGRVGHSATLMGANIVLFGGGASGVMYNDVWLLDTVTLVWSKPTIAGDPSNHPGPRMHHTAVTANNDIFIFGGLTEPEKLTDVINIAKIGARISKDNAKSSNWPKHGDLLVTDSLLRFNTIRMQWTYPLVDGIQPGVRFRHAAVMTGERMLMFGGYQGALILWSLDTGLKQTRSNQLRSGISQSENANETLPVVSWLRELNLEQYSRLFVKAELDWAKLLTLTESDLTTLGITTFGPRKKMLIDLEKRRKEAASNKILFAKGLFKGRYRLEEEVMMGSVAFRMAHDVKMGRDVLLRTITDLATFRREVSLFQTLRSDYLADLLDYHEDSKGGKSHVIVLPRPTTTLSQVLLSTKLEYNDRKFVIDRLARLVEVFHTHNYVIGDLKAGGLGLFEMKWKIVDLSAARLVGDELDTGRIPLYCSPEIARSIDANTGQLLPVSASKAIDIWALGALSVEILARRHFMRIHGDLGPDERSSVLSNIADNEAIRVPDSVKDDQARHLFMKMLHKDPTWRCKITAVLKHAFLVGGLDTQEYMAAFTYLSQVQSKLLKNLVKVKDHVRRQKHEEERMETQIEIKRSQMDDETQQMGEKHQRFLEGKTPRAPTKQK